MLFARPSPSMLWIAGSSNRRRARSRISSASLSRPWIAKQCAQAYSYMSAGTSCSSRRDRGEDRAAPPEDPGDVVAQVWKPRELDARGRETERPRQVTSEERLQAVRA